MAIHLKRIYDLPAESDGARVLVDRLWPRGISKEDAALVAWLRDVAPSNELRQWYHTNTEQWPAFRKRYLAELRAPEAERALSELYGIADAHATVTLVFASRNLERNNALVLKELLEGKKKPPTSSGPVRAVASRRALARRPR